MKIALISNNDPNLSLTIEMTPDKSIFKITFKDHKAPDDTKELYFDDQHVAFIKLMITTYLDKK